jgi:hypothetical protein
MCESSANVALKRLEQRGLVSLPAPLPRPKRTRPRQLVDDGQDLPEVPPVGMSLGEVRLQLIQDQHDPDHGLWNRLIIREHPLKGAPLFGAQLRYIIRYQQWVADLVDGMGGASVGLDTWNAPVCAAPIRGGPVATHGSELVAPQDNVFRVTWLDQNPAVNWGRNDYSWAGEFNIAPWFWTPFELRFMPKATGVVRFLIMGPWELNAANRVRMRPVEWDTLEVLGTRTSGVGEVELDGDFEGDSMPSGWSWSGPGVALVPSETARSGEQVVLTWHDGPLLTELQVEANQAVIIRGWARSARAVELEVPDRLPGGETPAHVALERFRRGMNLGNSWTESCGAAIGARLEYCRDGCPVGIRVSARKVPARVAPP